MKRAYLILYILLCIAAKSSAQGLFETAGQAQNQDANNQFNLSGYVRGTTYGGGKIFDVISAYGEVGLNTKLKANKFILNSDLRFRRGYAFNQHVSEFELKEAYAGISTSAFDLLLGEQIISWGRTDGFNPTNNITPNNYFFFSAEPNDQKIPNFMLSANIRFTPMVNWEFMAIPFFRPSVYRYNFFDMGENVSFADDVLPTPTIENGSLATKINIELSGIGFSLSWFHGYDPFYGFNLRSINFETGTPIITYIPSFYKKNTLGIDFAIPAGSWILRGEGAYNITENETTAMHIPKSNLNYVVGLEHNFWGLVAIMQYIGNFTPNFTELSTPTLSDPLNPMAQLQYANEMIWFESAAINRKIFKQTEETNHALSLTLSKDFAYETINMELTGFYDLTSEEYLIRPKLLWKIGDALTATVGYSYMNGPDKSIFNYASPIMNGAFMELKASF